jgi:hypothetical protein
VTPKSPLSANEHSANIQSYTLADQHRKSADPKTQTLWQLVAIDKSPTVLQEKIKKYDHDRLFICKK